MDKRLVLFCVITALILGGQALIQSQRRPDAVAKAKADAEKNKAKGSGDATGKGDAKAQVGPDSETPNADGKPAETGDPTKPGDAPPSDDQSTKPDETKQPSDDGKPVETPARPQTAPQWITLGSLDPESGFRLLVTLNNRGAAIERIEVSSPKYRDLENHAGYLGHLGLTLDPEGRGCVVQTVGAGTPAARAIASANSGSTGLQVGDIINGIDGRPSPSNVAVEEYLKNQRPDATLELDILRGDQKLKYSVKLERHPLEIIRPERQTRFDSANGFPLSCPIELDTLATGARSLSIARDADRLDKLPSLVDARWEIVESTGDSVEFRYLMDAATLKAVDHAGSLEFRKRYRLAKAPDNQLNDDTAAAYHVDMEIEIRTADAADRQVAYRIDGVNGLPLEGWWYIGKAGARDVVARTDAGGQRWFRAPELYKKATKTPNEAEAVLFSEGEPTNNRAVRYIGVDSQYFAAMLIPQGSEGGPGIFRRAAAFGLGDVPRIPSGHNKTLNVSFSLTSEVARITPEAPLLHKYVLFAGPKQPDLLHRYGATAKDGRGFFTLNELLDYGWFGIVSRPLSQLLHFFYWLVGNYGLAIIMLTVVVRSCMLPISRGATKNAQKMQELSPELKKIAEKYKEAPEKRVKAQQELFRKHKYNPFGGCLLALMQLPIFIGLYRCLSIDLELRQASLIPGLSWCSNLAGPDMLWEWSKYLPSFLADETGYLGPYLNVLPFVTVGLFLINQKLITPPATDEQTRMQQQVMKFMTLFMGIMFFKVASGLCIYFICSSCWSLGEHKILRKGKIATPT